MLKIRYIVFALLFVFFSKASFATEARSCGVNKSCASGYYCSGAIGESESGICVANSVNIALCRFVDYVRSDMIRYFLIFASVFAGVYFFIGKFALVTFAQIVIGIAVLLGSQQLIIKVTGSSSGLCSREKVKDCAKMAQTISTSQVSTVVRNLANDVDIEPRFRESGGKTKCKSLECVMASCEDYKIIDEEKDKKGNITKEHSCEKQGRMVEVSNLPFDKDNVKEFNVSPKNCPSDFSVSCTPNRASFERIYFKCNNTCTNEEFAAEAPKSWNITSCAELMQKQISYK